MRQFRQLIAMLRPISVPESCAMLIARQAEIVAGFGDALPACDSAVSCYAMHLATSAEAALMWWRLADAGARVVAVVTPFKQRPADPGHYFALELAVKGPHGPDGKTIHGRLYRRTD